MDSRITKFGKKAHIGNTAASQQLTGFLDGISDSISAGPMTAASDKQITLHMLRPMWCPHIYCET